MTKRKLLLILVVGAALIPPVFAQDPANFSSGNAVGPIRFYPSGGPSCDRASVTRDYSSDSDKADKSSSAQKADEVR